MNKTVHFKTNVELKSVVGKDLINDDNIALIELIKNSYDALSPSVKIEFHNIVKSSSPEDSVIIISDRGIGMDVDDIEKKWLNIAYSEKKTKHEFRDRHLAGNKGVGRFSCDRLGSVLNMYTRKNRGQYVHLHVNWEDFESRQDTIDIEIQSIPINLRTITAREFSEAVGIHDFLQGTVLKITSLRNSWSESKILALRKALEKFANPNQDFDQDAFYIDIYCPEYATSEANTSTSKINGRINNQIFTALGFKASYITATVSSDSRTITTSLTHKNQKLFTLKECSPYSGLGDVRMVIYYMGPVQKAFFMRQVGVRAKDFGTMFLFLNGFRVAPYGDPYDDWLGIDQRKAQGTRRYLGTRDVIGRIEISGDNWNVVSSREGLVKNASFVELTGSKGLFLRTLKKLEKYVVDGIGWDSAPDGTALQLQNYVKDPSWVDSDSYYLETEAVKRRRVIEQLSSIITSSTKPTEIISIEFDAGLVELLKSEEDARFSQVLSDFEQLNIGIANIRELTNLRNAIIHERNEAEKTRRYLIKLEKDNVELKSVAKTLKKEAETHKAISVVREEENLFLKATSSQDLDDVINMHHHIALSADIVSKESSYWTDRLLKNKPVSNDELLSGFQTINKEIQKILRYSQFASKKNFRIAIPRTKGNIVRFISDYLSEIKGLSAFDKLTISFKDEGVVILRQYSPIELTILLDNIFHNASKAGATKLLIHSKIVGPLSIISFQDNGKGLPKDIPVQSLFSKGVTTTDGSGLGLFHAKEIVAKLHGVMRLSPGEECGTVVDLEFKQ